jgi:hypothetical protein
LQRLRTAEQVVVAKRDDAGHERAARVRRDPGELADLLIETGPR